MTTRKKLVGNVLLSGISEGSNILTFLLGVLAARYLGDESFGRFSFALAFTALFQLLPDFGVSYASTIEIARDRSKAAEAVGNIVGLQLLTSVMTTAVILSCTWLFVPAADRLVVVITAVTMILRTFKLTFRWLLKSYERFDIEAATLVSVRTASFVFGWMLLARGGGLFAFVLFLLAVQTADTAATAVLVGRAIAPVSPRFHLARAGSLLKRGFPFALMYSLTYAFFNINTVVLRSFRGDAEVGWFNAPYRILEGLVIIPSAISYGLLPSFSIMHQTDRERLSDIYRRALKYLLMIALPMAVFVTFESGRIVALVFGPGYARSSEVFRVLIWSSVFMFLSHLASTLLTCIDRQWTVIRIAGSILAFNVLLNLLLVPQWGMHGAAWASLGTEIAYAAVLVGALRHYGFRLQRVRWVWGPVIATVAFGAATVVTGSLPVIAQGAACSLAYVALLFLCRSFDQTELETIRGILRLPGRG